MCHLCGFEQLYYSGNTASLCAVLTSSDGPEACTRLSRNDCIGTAHILRGSSHSLRNWLMISLHY